MSGGSEPRPERGAPDLFSSVRNRIDAVERDSRRTRRLGSVMLIGIAVVLGVMTAIVILSARRGFGGPTPDVVEARRFAIRDARGQIRGVWGVTKDGRAQIVLSDSSGRERLRLQVLRDGSSGIALVDSANRSRIVLATLPDQTATLVLADPAGRTRTVLGLNPNGASTVVFADKSGTTRAGLGVDAQGSGTFTLVDRTGATPQAARQSDEDSVSQGPTPDQTPTRRVPRR
jgi:hypothetical protein